MEQIRQPSNLDYPYKSAMYAPTNFNPFGSGPTLVLSSPPSSNFTFVVFSRADRSFIIEATFPDEEDLKVNVTSGIKIPTLEMELYAVEVASSLAVLANR